MTYLEGACMSSLDLVASEFSNMNGSEVLKCCSVTNRTDSWWNIQPCVHAKHVCVHVCTCVYQHISFWETKTVMATSTSKIRNSTFYSEQYPVKNIAHSFFMLKPRIFCTIFTVILCCSIHMALLVFSTSVCSLVRILLL